jgi:hypothetical protein
LLPCALQQRNLLNGATHLVRPPAPLTVLAVGSPRRWNRVADSEFCPHVDAGRTSERTSTSDLLSRLRATDEIHQVDPETWTVPPGASGFHLPGVRGGRDQRGRAGSSGIVEARQVSEPCARVGAHRPRDRAGNGRACWQARHRYRAALGERRGREWHCPAGADRLCREAVAHGNVRRDLVLRCRATGSL